MHSDCCQGPVQVLAVSVLFPRVLFPWPFCFHSPDAEYANHLFKHPHRGRSGTSDEQATILCLSPRLERNKRNHFVLNDAIDLSIRSHLRRSLCCRSSCEAHVVLSLILRHEPRDYPHEATTETNHRAAEKRRRCEALTEPLVNHRGVVRIIRRSLYSLSAAFHLLSLSFSLSFPISPLRSPAHNLSPTHLSTPLPLYFPQYFCFTRSSLSFLALSSPFLLPFFHFLHFSHAQHAPINGSMLVSSTFLSLQLPSFCSLSFALPFVQGYTLSLALLSSLSNFRLPSAPDCHCRPRYIVGVTARRMYTRYRRRHRSL